MKKTIVILAFLTSVPALLQASPVLNLLHQKLAARREAPPTGCADFSGNWKGSCTTNGSTSPEQQLHVTQIGCTTLMLGTEYLPIGGLLSEEFVSPTDNHSAFAGSVTTTSEWNGDKTVIELAYLGIVKEPTHSNGNPMVGKGTLQMVGSRLDLAATLSESTLHCSYDKE